MARDLSGIFFLFFSAHWNCVKWRKKRTWIFYLAGNIWALIKSETRFYSMILIRTIGFTFDSVAFVHIIWLQSLPWFFHFMSNYNRTQSLAHNKFRIKLPGWSVFNVYIHCTANTKWAGRRKRLKKFWAQSKHQQEIFATWMKKLIARWTNRSQRRV